VKAENPRKSQKAQDGKNIPPREELPVSGRHGRKPKSTSARPQSIAKDKIISTA
jgi:hypothetical protein